MPNVFNGDVTINGRAEFYGDGSLRITNGNVQVPVHELKTFIEKVLPTSPNKQEYINAAEVIAQSQDKSLIKNALGKIAAFAKESGKAIWISGLSTIASEVAKELVSLGL